MLTVTTDTSLTFDPVTNSYQLQIDRRHDEAVTAAVTRGVAAVTDTPLSELDPLFDTVDPDALNRLFDPTAGTSRRDNGWVSFEFNDCAVRVYAPGIIEITPAEDKNRITAPVPRTLRDR